MKTKLKSCGKYEDIRDAQDTTELLKLIKDICYNLSVCGICTVRNTSAMDRFIKCKQSYDMRYQMYLDKFNNALLAL